MSLNDGKPKKEVFTFLDREYRVDMIPCGVSIPFSVEVDKTRVMSMEVAEKAGVDGDKVSDMGHVINQYFAEHPVELQEYQMAVCKSVSVITEFYTDGEVSEDYILKNASNEEITDFMMALREGINAPLKKHQEKSRLTKT